jgi:two-component system, chemotaxis family, CheB/CheR fusion protein
MTQSDAAASPLENPHAAARELDILSPSPKQFIVGIGASAGGLTALQDFFGHMPAASGMAFVVIVHLPPEHESSLPAILQQHTSMPVLAVTEPVRVEPNHIYVIPPASHLSMQDGMIQLSEPDRPRGRRVPIDLFFRTLAETHASQAAAIVLSGVGADGTLGLTRVKELGGVTLVQEPSEAEYPDMPRSAIATGFVDFVLPVAQMPQQLLAYQQHPTNSAISLEAHRNPDEEALRDILTIMRARTGHDFSHYKRSTLLRRIGRRLVVHNLDSLVDYPAVLRAQLTEIQALLRDFLISVTNFFRDPAAFAALEAIVPHLFTGKTADDQVRVWVAGCATGDEAYSVAMLLTEHAAQLDQPPSIQVFATDIDEDAITVAREGLYVETIANDLSPERLQRFFTPEFGRYRINKAIRDLVLFATHNLLRDPPFSKIDLVTCRNLLIYLNRDAQQQVLSLFHFALRPQGYLFLGSAESSDGVHNLFATIDKQQRLYQRHFGGSAPPPLPAPPLASPQRSSVVEARTASMEQRHSLHDLHQELLAPYAPPSVLINESQEIVHFSSRATRWLEFRGEPSFNLLSVVHPALRIELRSTLLAATQGHKRPEVRRVQINDPDALHQIDLRVHPLHMPDWAKGLTLVIFEEVQTADATTVPARSDDDGDILQQQLEAENQRLKEQLRATIEQYETSLEELKASNEELQATAEEYRAATEELETSKEELQSVNEELSTVNDELKHKVDEVSQANNDLHNLLVATDIGTLFLDRALFITRYTPRVRELFNIIPTDLNRPLAHVTHTLNYDHLAQDAAQVLERLMPIEREVRNHDGRWYLMRVLPYRTLQDRIDGVVVTFIEITARKQSEEVLRRNDERFRLLYEYVRDYAIFSIDTEQRVRDWNVGAERIFGYAPVEIIGQSVRVLFTPEDIAAGEHEHELQRAAADGSTDDERWHMRRGGTRFYVSGITTALYDESGAVQSFLKIGRDLTERKQAEEQLRQGYAALEQRVAERTAELSTLNTNLERAMAERQRVEGEREQVLRQLMTAQEEERRRISRDLHDQMGQEITALLLALDALEGGTSNPQTRSQLNRARGLANHVSLELHQLALQLRPTALDDLGLEEALANYGQEWAKQTGVELDTHTHGLDGQRLPMPIATTAFRAVQEALTNVLKHAGARSVSVIVGRRAGELTITVEDDGRGFDVDTMLARATAENRLGLIGMRERVALVRGTLTIDSTPGRGTTVLIRIPILDQSAEEADDREPAGGTGG